MKDYQKIYQEWLDSPLLSQNEKEELLSIKDNDELIQDRFYKDLEFGTGGLRGIMGMGSNRMNRFVIKRATQGLANYLIKTKKVNISVAIAYDTRNNSSAFAKEAASTLVANGIKVFLYKEPMPTPSLSFAVRYFKCDAGLVITASHNPKIYNGYKVYDETGAQCTDNLAKSILDEILKLNIFNDVKSSDYNKSIDDNKIILIEDDCFNAYMSSTLKQSIYNETKDLKIVYTPLNGAGKKCVTTILKLDGFNDVKIVKEQEQPDGNFPTCPYPNPEIKEALTLGIDELIATSSDLLVATDPDSDRCGVVINKDGIPHILSGNEVGLIIFDAIYHHRKINNLLPNNPLLIKTIVSTDMATLMANKYGVVVKEVLTGFKYIGEQMHLLENSNSLDNYLLGFEESCGYLTNPDIRDKDAVNAVLLVCEIANHLKKQGLTLIDKLNEIYKEFGDYKTALLTHEFPGIEGMDKITSIMNFFRNNESSKIFDDIESIGDYQLGYIFKGNIKEETHLPKSNVIKFFLKDKSTITIRPSGTEPKIKIYIFANGEDRLNKLKTIIEGLIK